MMTRILERPGLLFTLLLAGGLALGAGMTRLASEPSARATRMRLREPMPKHLCPTGVTEWRERYGEEIDIDEE